nr:hypothetical protein [Tanacetum cinerariifolium]
MVPRAVLLKSGILSIARQNFSKPEVLVNTARQVNTAHPKATVNAARQMSYLSKLENSSVKRPIQKNTTFNNINVNQRINTVRSKTVNTARPKAVVNAVQGNIVNAVKASTCWGSPQMDLPDKGVIDSRCLRHMTWNMSYLTDYEEIDKGYVAFGGNPKGGKITGKGTIRTEAVNTACDVENRVLVVKPHNKTPYELFHGSGPDWLFNIDALTRTMNYEPIVAGTQSNSFAGAKESDNDDVFKPSSDNGKKVNEDLRQESKCKDQEKEDNVKNTNNVNFAGTNGFNAIARKDRCIAFEKLMHEKFQMSSMGELTFFLGLQVKQNNDGIFISQDKYVGKILKKFRFTEVKNASTPMETKKSLLKDEDVCACARYQVNPKASHLYAVKRISRYLKVHPKLGLWYPKDSLFDLVAYTDSDYARASLDKKSTTGGCQYLGSRLISWQCKRQIVVANSITEAEYVSASSCCGQVLWIQNQFVTPLFIKKTLCHNLGIISKHS